MSNDKNPFERLLRLQTKTNQLALEGKRDIEILLDHLQKVLEMPDLVRIPKNALLVYETTAAWSPDRERRFVVANEFRPEVEYGVSGVHFRATSSFMEFFGNLVEEPIKDVCLELHKLLQPADGDTIAEALGGWSAAKTGMHEMKMFLMHMTTEYKYVFLTKHAKGEGKHCFVCAEWKNEAWELFFVGRSVRLHPQDGYRIVSTRKNS